MVCSPCWEGKAISLLHQPVMSWRDTINRFPNLTKHQANTLRTRSLPNYLASNTISPSPPCLGSGRRSAITEPFEPGSEPLPSSLRRAGRWFHIAAITPLAQAALLFFPVVGETRSVDTFVMTPSIPSGIPVSWNIVFSLLQSQENKKQTAARAVICFSPMDVWVMLERLVLAEAWQVTSDSHLVVAEGRTLIIYLSCSLSHNDVLHSLLSFLLSAMPPSQGPLLKWYLKMWLTTSHYCGDKRGEIWYQRGDGTNQRMKFAFSIKKQECNSRLVDKSSGMKSVWTLLRRSHRLLKHLLAGKTSRLIAEVKTIYKMALFLGGTGKGEQLFCRRKPPFFCVL